MYFSVRYAASPSFKNIGENFNFSPTLMSKGKKTTDPMVAFPQHIIISGINDQYGRDLTSKDIEDKKSNNNDGKMEELRSFAQNTTLHGARLLFAGNIFRVLLWL